MTAEYDVVLSSIHDMVALPWKYQWEVSGLGMLRVKLNNTARLAIWDHRIQTVKNSLIHTHPWSFDSTIFSGMLINHRFMSSENGWGVSHWLRQEVAKDGLVGEPVEVALSQPSTETYVTGMRYSQTPDEIHYTEFEDGTITLLNKRLPATPAPALVFWPEGQEWQNASARPATPEEIAGITGLALTKLTLPKGLPTNAF